MLVLGGPAAAFAQTSEPAGGPPPAPCCEGPPGVSCHHRAPFELAPLPAGASDKERWLRRIHEQAEQRVSPLLGRRGLGEARAKLDGLPAGAPFAERAGALWVYANYALGSGELEDAIAQFEHFVRLLEEDGELGRAALVEALFHLGLAGFRLAERQNCIAAHNSDSCIFPLSEQARHHREEGARRALAALERALELDPEHLEARWLYNIAHMALGSWPDGVPERQRFPPERFASEQSLRRFYDVAPALGIHRLSRAGSALLDDLDGDGRLDVLSSSLDTGQPLRFYRNGGGGAFLDLTESAGLLHQLGGGQVVHGDVDGDGRLDLLVLRGADFGLDGELPNSLLLQTPGGRFDDRTRDYGIELAAPARSAAFADFDLDGDLDLFIGYETHQDPGGSRWPSRLYRNEQGRRYTDVTQEAGLELTQACAGAVFGDCDGDRLPELFLSLRNAPNRLYANLGGGRFRDRAAALGVTEPLDSGAAALFDSDNDGDLDLLVTDQRAEDRGRAVAAWYWDGTLSGGTPRLFENDGRGRFRDATAERGLLRVIFANGFNFGDLDGDGWLDLYFATGDLEMSSLWPNVALRNDGGRRFLDVTQAAGLGHLQKGQTVAFGDLDDDGDQDILLQVGGLHLDDAFWDVLFENPGHGARWLQVELRGVQANRFAVGARVRVRIGEGEQERDLYRWAGGNSSGGGNGTRLEFGLGRAERIVELEVQWPGAGAVQRFHDLPLDSRVRVVEGEDRLAVQRPAAVKLGG